MLRAVQPPGARRATAAGIIGGILCAWLVGVTALAQFVDVTAVLARPGPARGEPAGLPPLPERLSTLPESVEQLRAMLAARARARPDARFLLAVADLHRVHRGVSAVVTARFDGGRWTVLHGNAVVGSLPEAPDFPDALALLAGWSRSLERPPARPSRAALPPEAAGWGLLAPGARVVATLDRLGALWTLGVRSPELYAAAARAAASLCLATPPAAELSDPVEARALAALALAGGADMELPDVAALVASRLGYGSAARGSAAALPADHPVRAAMGAPPHPTRTLPEALRALEASRNPNGPFLDRELLARRDAATLGAALLADLKVRVRTNGPRAALAWVVALDREAPDGLRPVLAWAAHVARVAADAERAETLLHLLTPSSPTPPSLLADAARVFAADVDRDNPRRQQGHDFLLTHLDSRPAHVRLRAEAVRRDADDRAQARSLCDAFARVRGERDPACGEAPDDVFNVPSVPSIARDAGVPPPARRSPIQEAAAAYGRGDFDALWSVASDDVDDVAHREYIWLLRAMASVRSGPNDPRRLTVTTHFLGDDVDEFAVMGRCLLGRAAARDVIALAESEPLRALALYTLGVRAEAEGRAGEAADWYQLTRLAGSAADREFRWAAERLAALGDGASAR